MSAFERMMRRMHDPLSRKPGPVLTALMQAFARSIDTFDIRAAQRSLYLESARGVWLDFWANLYSYTRDDLTDAELLAQMKALTLLERRKTTKEAIVAAIKNETGFTPSITLGREKVYCFDAAPDGSYAFDATGAVNTQEAVFINESVAHRGSQAKLSLSAGWGPSGVWITMPCKYQTQLATAIIPILETHLKAGAGFALGWAQDFNIAVHDGLKTSDDAPKPIQGWSYDKWGRPKGEVLP